MSWHYSRALVAEYSAATCSDGKQSAQLSANPTPQAYLCKDRMTAFSRLSRFGMTFAPLTDDLGADLLTWFLADSRVRTYHLPGMVPELMASAPGCGEKWRESSVRYDLASSSWKTHLSLFPEDLPWSSVTLPKWGMTRSGAVYQHPTLERPISATEYGLWQTPVADDSVSRAKGKWNSRGEPKLSGQVMSPAHWPTPNASDGRKWSNQSLAERKAKGQQIRLNTAVSPAGGAGGQLNPTWVEWLMGWPLGWTDLKPLAMDKSLFAWQQHFKFFQENK